jgi:ATP-dependent protease HslVU (ClpYQ) peptidase subunit
MEEKKQKLITQVIEQIKEDINDNYLESLEELVNLIPNENLLGYLQEEKANEITQQFLNN